MPSQMAGNTSGYTPNSSTDSNLTLSVNLLQENLALTVTKFLVLGVIMLMGVVGNILVIVVSTKRKAFKSSLDLYLKNLAVADLGFLLLIIPPAVLRAESPFQWPLGGFVCRYLFPLVEIFHGASVWIIVAVAAERYRNIVGMVHVQRRRYSGNKAALIAVALAWVLSFTVFCVPEYLMIQYIEGPGYAVCTLQFPDPDGKEIALQLYVILMTAFSYILPLVGITWTYVAISRQLNRSNTFLRSIKTLMRKRSRQKLYVATTGRRLTFESLFRGRKTSCLEELKMQERDGRRLTQNKRAKKILTPVAITFAVTMLPINLMRITILYWREILQQEYYQMLFFITIIFTATNSSLNPILYSIVSLDFRNSLKSLFHKSIERIRSFTSSSFARASSFGREAERESPERKVHSQTILSTLTVNGEQLLVGRDRGFSAGSDSTKC